MDANKTQALSADPNRTQLGGAPMLDPNKTMMGSAPTLNATITIKPVQCPVCKTFNPAGLMFCNECGLIFDRALPEDAFGAAAVILPCLVDAGGREHTLRPGTTTIGREGDISVEDAKVSRKHAQIFSKDGVLTLQDLGSTNGTKLNGEKLTPNTPQALKEGDAISFGGVEMKLSIPGAANATGVIAPNRTAAMEAPPQLEKPAAQLVGEGQEFPLKTGINSFGRKGENEVQISDPYVSGKHGLIELADDGVYLTDVGSTNGTMLNDAKLTPNQRTKLNADDVIRLGKMEFRVKKMKGH